MGVCVSIKQRRVKPMIDLRMFSVKFRMDMVVWLSGLRVICALTGRAAGGVAVARLRTVEVALHVPAAQRAQHVVRLLLRPSHHRASLHSQ